MATKEATKPEGRHIDFTQELTPEQKELIAGSQHIQDLLREVTRLQVEHDKIDIELETAEAKLEAAIEATTAANAEAPPPPPPEGGATRKKDNDRSSADHKHERETAKA